MKWKSKLLSYVQLFETSWTIQSMEFSRPEYWSGWLSPLQYIYEVTDKTRGHTLFICVPGTEKFISWVLKFVFIELNQIKSILCLWFFNPLTYCLWISPNGEKCHVAIRYRDRNTNVCHSARIRSLPISQSQPFIRPASIADLQCERHPGYSWYFEEVKDQLTNSSQVAQVFCYYCPDISHSPIGGVRHVYRNHVRKCCVSWDDYG